MYGKIWFEILKKEKNCRECTNDFLKVLLAHQRQTFYRFIFQGAIGILILKCLFSLQLFNLKLERNGMQRLREIISAVTFVGIIFHEFGHKLFCNLTGVKVIKVCYFRFGNPPGYVIHERAKNFVQSFFISVGPFISGTFFALLFFEISKSLAPDLWQKYFFIWLGGSVAINSFPSSTDAKGLWKDSNRHLTRNALAIIGYPFALLIWIADALKVVWFDLIYTFLLYYLLNSQYV